MLFVKLKINLTLLGLFFYIFFSSTSYAAYDIELKHTELAEEYSDYTHIYIRNFNELVQPPFSGVYSAFMLRKPNGTQDNYYARIFNDNGAVSVKFITPEECSKNNVGSNDAEAYMQTFDDQLVWFAKFCDGKTYFHQPVGITSVKVLEIFIEQPKYQTVLNNTRITFDTTGFTDTLEKSGINIKGQIEAQQLALNQYNKQKANEGEQLLIEEKYDLKAKAWQSDEEFLEYMLRISQQGVFKFVSWRETKACMDHNQVGMKRCFLYNLGILTNSVEATSKGLQFGVCPERGFDYMKNEVSFHVGKITRIGLLKVILENAHPIKGLRFPYSISSKEAKQTLLQLIHDGYLLRKEHMPEDNKTIKRPDFLARIVIKDTFQAMNDKFRYGSNCY